MFSHPNPVWTVIGIGHKYGQPAIIVDIGHGQAVGGRTAQVLRGGGKGTADITPDAIGIKVTDNSVQIVIGIDVAQRHRPAITIPN